MNRVGRVSDVSKLPTYGANARAKHIDRPDKRWKFEKLMNFGTKLSAQCVCRQNISLRVSCSPIVQRHVMYFHLNCCCCAHCQTPSPTNICFTFANTHAHLNFLTGTTNSNGLRAVYSMVYWLQKTIALNYILKNNFSLK